MLHDRSPNQQINEIHERALRIAYKNSCSYFNELLTTENIVSIHHKSLQLLANEIYKSNNLNPISINPIFEEQETPYTLRSGRNTLARKTKHDKVWY